MNIIRYDKSSELQQFFTARSVNYTLPYLDHCYAANLPGLEEEVPLMPGSIPDTLGAFLDIDYVSCNTTVVTESASRTERKKYSNSYEDDDDDEDEEVGRNTGGDEYADSVTRCICDMQHDDGFMISCDRCSVWQHVDCMGIDKSNIPESYLCELCFPRPIDKRKAILLQNRKLDQIVDSTTDSGDENDSGPSVKKRRYRKRKQYNDYDDNDDEFDVPSYHAKRGRKRFSPDFAEDNFDTSPDFVYRPQKKKSSISEIDHNMTIDHSVEDICLNTYTDNACYLLSTTFNHMPGTSRDFFNQSYNSQFPNTNILKDQISKPKYRVTDVVPESKGTIAIDVIRANQAIAEFTGNVMTKEEYEKSDNFDSSYTSVLSYKLSEGMTLCVDARHWDNSIKHIRSSCIANAKVMHIIEQNTIRFFICAIKTIQVGREITIPFYFDFDQSSKQIFCPCEKATCMVKRYYSGNNKTRTSRVGRPRLTDPKTNRLEDNQILYNRQIKSALPTYQPFSSSALSPPLLDPNFDHRHNLQHDTGFMDQLAAVASASLPFPNEVLNAQNNLNELSPHQNMSGENDNIFSDNQSILGKSLIHIKDSDNAMYQTNVSSTDRNSLFSQNSQNVLFNNIKFNTHNLSDGFNSSLNDNLIRKLKNSQDYVINRTLGGVGGLGKANMSKFNVINNVNNNTYDDSSDELRPLVIAENNPATSCYSKRDNKNKSISNNVYNNQVHSNSGRSRKMLDKIVAT